ncbi:MAG: hypothetical protein ACLP6G_18185 [Terriglobales bacterium]
MRPPSASRFIALSIVAAGILTLFWPLVTVDPPVAGTTRWSCLTIVKVVTLFEENGSYQGTASAVPLKARDSGGFSRWGLPAPQRLKPDLHCVVVWHA